MGILKSKAMKGMNITYWKIASSVIDYNKRKTSVSLLGYISKDIRDANANNMISNDTIHIDGIYETREEQYDFIKTTNNYLEATDI